MMPEAKPNADKDTIRRFLTEITAGWSDLEEPASIELRCLMPDRIPDVSRYSPDAIGFDMLIDHATAMNEHGLNIYVVVNPVRASAPVRRNGKMSGAFDEDILASFYFWADCDTAEAAQTILNFAGPKWTMAIMTGTTPAPRPHIYWRMEEACLNLPAWTEIQKAIAARLGTDRSVVNPARIMRMPGTINHPTEKKAAKGYITEIVTLRTEYDDDRSPVSFEQMRRVFPPMEAPSGTFQIDTGGHGTSMDRALAVANIKAGTDWRNNLKSLVASYVALGWADDDILDRCEAFTLDGYTRQDTRQDTAAFIAWTREREAANGGKYAVSPTYQPNEFREMSDAEKEAVEPLMFAPWGHRDLAAIPAPQFVYSDFYARGYTSVTLAPPKVGKSMLGLAEAVDMATGRGFLTGYQTERRRVVYYNAEDDQAVIDSRVAALLEHYRIDQSEIADTLFPVSGVEAEGFYMVTGQDGTINEPLFVALEKFIAAQKADVLIFDPLQDMSRSPETNEVFRVLGQRLRRMASKHRVAVGLIHHTRKIAPGMTPTIDDGRGGSALRGTARFNRLLISMTEDEAAKAGIPNHRHFMRIGDIESNIAPPSADVNRWFQKISVEIPNGHHVGAVEPWQWPDAFDGVTSRLASRCQAAVAACDPPARANSQAREWVGNVIAPMLGIDPDDKGDRARLNTIIRRWIAEDVLRTEVIPSRRDGRDVPVVVVGNNRISED